MMPQLSESYHVWWHLAGGAGRCDRDTRRSSVVHAVKGYEVVK